jgi:hypothetical protein
MFVGPLDIHTFMKNEDQLELMGKVHALSISVIHLVSRVMVLESTLSAVAQQQRDILVRMGADPKVVEDAFERAKADAFERVSESTPKQFEKLSGRALKKKA